MSRGMGTFSPLCDAAEAQAVPSGPTRPQSCRAGRRGTQAHSLRRQRTQHLRATLSATLPAPSGARAPSAELWSLQLHDTGATFAAALPQDRDCPSPVDTAFDVPPWLASEADGQPVPPPPSGGDPEGNQYYLQCGVAIRTLRDEFPHVFSRDLSFDIYRDDLVFTDAGGCLPGVPAQAVGKDAYRRMFWSLRLHGALFFARPPLVSILRIWQPRDGMLAVRWSIAAQPRLLSSFGADDVHYDGISEYKLDRNGRIYEHRISNVDWGGQEPLKSRSLAALLASLAPNQLPTPSFFSAEQRVDGPVGPTH